MSMERILAGKCAEKIGKKVLVNGWIHDKKNLGGIKFISVKDRSGLIQITLDEKRVSKEVLEKIDAISKESVVEIQGQVVEEKRAPNQIELIPSKINLLSSAELILPIDTTGKTETDLSLRLDNRFLDLRNPKNNAIFKLRSKMLQYITEFFLQNDFTQINTPKITSIGLESGAEVFSVDYFGKKAVLAQSPQLYKQMMVCSGLERVFEVAPVFRAEKSNTTRHQTEFTGIDFELGFIKDESEVMDLVEGMLKYMLTKLQENDQKLLDFFKIKIKVPKKIPRISHSEIRKLLKENGKEIAIDNDLDAEAEKLLGEIIAKKFNEEFVFALNYPFKKRPFYHMKPNGDELGTRSFDLLWNGVEIATGAQREHRYEILKAQAKSKGINLDEMPDYAKIFRFGCPPHGGVGFGLDRLVQRLLKFNNIREAILLPRDPERLKP